MTSSSSLNTSARAPSLPRTMSSSLTPWDCPWKTSRRSGRLLFWLCLWLIICSSQLQADPYVFQLAGDCEGAGSLSVRSQGKHGSSHPALTKLSLLAGLPGRGTRQEGAQQEAEREALLPLVISSTLGNQFGFCYYLSSLSCPLKVKSASKFVIQV